ncbi:tail fiber protein [Pseudomonas oryzihabitans]|nr:tail fiber protein [Pseudomonas psychrotolerans]
MSEATPENVVTLDQPIARGETRIEQLTLRKPNAGELRGVALSDLLSLNVDAIVRVTPRISQPAITEAEVRAMDPADLVDVGGKIVGFLLKKSDRAALFPAT